VRVIGEAGLGVQGGGECTAHGKEALNALGGKAKKAEPYEEWGGIGVTRVRRKCTEKGQGMMNGHIMCL